MKFANAFYGRQAELSVLSESLDRASRGEKQVVLIAGRPGVGKSALMAKLRQAASDRQGYFVAGKFDQYKRNIPYAAAPEAFQQLISIIVGEPEERLAWWRERLTKALGANIQIIADVIPDITRIFEDRKLPQPPQLGPLESRNRFYRVFRAFTGALTSADHPLCVLIDDLQWADAASLGLIEMVLADPTIGHIMLVGAYRSNEVDAFHPAMMTFRSLEKAGIQVKTIPLAGLGATDINGFVADTLGCLPSASHELATHLYRKTEGNPFFVRQLLDTYYQQDLIAFDRAKDEWTWNMAAIRASRITDDVAELMRDKVAQFPLEARQCLMAAACLGSSFTVDRLAQAMGETTLFVSESLRSVIDAGFLGESESTPGRDKTYLFVHDRVQQAAYGLIPEDRLQRFRLEIGQRLLASLPPESTTAEQLSSLKSMPVEQLDIVSNLNHGSHLITLSDERYQLLRLNLAAGRTARASLAYREALNYLRHARKLLQPDVWTLDHQLAFDIHRECLECEYQTGNLEEADSLFEVLLERAAPRVQKAQIYYTKVLLNTSAARYEEAIRIGIDALKLFGISISRSPSKASLLAELMTAMMLVLRRPVESIATLPRMSDVERIEFTRILMAMLPPGYFVDPNILMLAGLKIMTTSLRHGNAPVSAIGYVLYGLANVAVLGAIRSGHAFGELAVRLGDEFKDVSVQTKTRVIHGGFVRFWRGSIDESIDMLREAYTLALSSGDFQYANYAILQIVFLSFARGERLKAVDSECRNFRNFVHETKDAFAIDSLAIWQQSVRALRGETESATSLGSEEFDEARVEARLRKQKNLTALGYLIIRKLHLTYLFGDYDAALDYGLSGEKFVELLPGQILLAEQSLYFGLTLVALRRRGRAGGSRLARALRRCDRRLRRWASYAPDNFEHMSLLLRAEIASLDHSAQDAGRLYESAIKSARKHGFTHIEALALERAASWNADRNLTIPAESYLERAIQTYERWGATAKLRQLRNWAAAKGIRIATPEPEKTKPVAVSAGYEAPKEGTGETGLSELLGNLVKRVREATGAERGAVILRESGQPILRVIDGDPGIGPVIEPVHLDKTSSVSSRIVNYCIRKRADIIVTDAVSDQHFHLCPYVRQQLTKSVLCTPIVKQGEILGAVYLENNRVAGAFDDAAWIPNLHKITEEFAMLIENARMYGRLQENKEALGRLQQITKHLEAFVPAPVKQRISENPQHPDLERREKDVSVLFVDVQDSTLLSDRLGAKGQVLFARYFAALSDEIRRNGGNVIENPGDQIVATFETPQLHAIQAVRAALAVRDKTTALNRERDQRDPAIVMKIGVNSGLALVGPKDAGAFHTYAASGPVANLAARIMAFCSDGSVLVSEDTARRVSGRFELAPLSPEVFKGISTPQHLCRVEKARPADGEE
jgi:predicted ATPase/class 3 adenylate cyclase